MLIGVASICITGAFPARRFGPEKIPDPGDISCAVAISVETIVADAVLALGQDVDEEPTDEFLGCERHGGMPPGVIDAVILDAEGDAGLIEPDQATV